MAFSKLIHADLLSAVQKVSALYTGTGNLSTNANVADYTADAKKAVIFTDDNYIVTHGHQYYTGLPFSTEQFVDDVVLTGIQSGQIVPVALWKGNASDGLSKLTAGTRYGIQMDEQGHAFVAIGSAQTNSLVMSKGVADDLYTGTGVDKTLIADTAQIVYNPGNTQTNFKFVGGDNQFSMLANYKTGYIDTNGDFQESTEKTEKLTVAINPVIANNVIGDTTTDEENNTYLSKANHLVMFSADKTTATGVDAASSLHVKDSGLMFTEDGMFSEVAGGEYAFDAHTLTTEAGVRDYVTNALGDIVGAMRYKGNSDGKWVAKTAGTATSTNDDVLDSDNTPVGKKVTVQGLQGVTPYLTTNASGNPVIKFLENSQEYPVYTISPTFNDYQQGDVYYASAAMAMDKGSGVYEIVEAGDLLVAKTPEKASTSTTPDVSDWTVAQSNWTAADGSSTVEWNKTTTLATIGGVNIDITMPSSPESKIDLLFKAGQVDAVTTKPTEDKDNILKYFTYTGDTKTAVSNNSNTTLSIGTLVKTIDGDTEVYTHQLFEIDVQGERDINVRTDANGKVLIGHTNLLTSAAVEKTDNANIAAVTKNLYTETEYTGANDTLKAELDALSFYKVSFDEYGHVNKAVALSNSLTFHTANTGAATGTEMGAKFATTTTVDDADTEFNGFTKHILVNGIENGDIKINAAWSQVTNGTTTYDVLSLTPSITKHFRAVKVNGTEMLGEYAYTPLDLVAGTNVRLTPNATAGTVTVSAVDTWRSIQYYATSATTAAVTDPLSNPAGITGDPYNDTEETLNEGQADETTQVVIEGKTIGQNALVFGTDFYVTQDTTSGTAEVSIEWCEISAVKTDGAVTGATITFTA